MRYERKYRIEEASEREILATLRQNPACFQSAFPDRYINSIYLDNFSFGALQENLAGISKRSKFRIRWYGKNMMDAQDPTLEIKIKNNFNNRKEFKKLPSFQLHRNFDCTAFLQEHLEEETRRITSLSPVSIVRYLRTYLVSQDKRVRATIDRELQYFLYQGNLLLANRPVYDKGIILEVKYEAGHDDYCDAIFQGIPFRLTKNSKYVSSINAFHL